MSKAAAEYVSTDSIHPHPKNPRLNDEAVAGVAASISEFGFGAPIVCRKADRTVIVGHTRLKAAKQLGLAQVPVRFLDLTEEQARKLMLADNKLGEVAGWDEGVLKDLLADMPKVDIELIGFQAADVDRIVSQVIDSGEKLLDYKPTHQLKKNADTVEEATAQFHAADVKQIVLYLPADQYAATVEKLGKLQEAHALTSNTEAVLFAIEQALHA